MVAAASATAIASDKPTNQRSAGTPSSRITTAPAAKIKPPRFPPTRIADMLISGRLPLIRHLLDGAYCTRTIIQVKSAPRHPGRGALRAGEALQGGRRVGSVAQGVGFAGLVNRQQFAVRPVA